MKVPLSWLREFVDVSGSAEEIAATMSVRGLAVESVDRLASSAEASAKADGDFVFDFETFANRPDTMSVLGIAREVATAYGLPLKTVEPPADPALRGQPAPDIEIILENSDLCPRYVGAVADVTVGPSPSWMQQRLAACGVRPISNIVDITNYVLLELGHPMHAFDRARLRETQIRVRNARADEVVKTLDGQTRRLTPDMLVIADGREAVAIAGVMGGAESEVASGTTAIVLESAYFDPLSVRRTSRKLGLKTEASMRFERGADPHLPATAMLRAIELLESTGAGKRRGGILDRIRSPFGVEPRSVELRRDKIRGLLGVAVPDDQVERILTSLGFSAVRTSSGWRVSVPTRRVDIQREVDLIEEVARHFGFDNVPMTFPSLTAPAPPSDPRIARTRQLRALMTGNGFSEAVTFGFVAETAAAPFAAAGDLVPIANPLSENFAVLRPSALPGIVDAVAHNRRREQRDVRLFEVGASFTRRQGERRGLVCAWTGTASPPHWTGAARDVDFFDMKGVVEGLASALRTQVSTIPHQASWLVPGRAAAVVSDGTRIGTLGQLTPAVAEAHGLPPSDPIYVAEIDLDAAEQCAATAELRVAPLPRFPSVGRDVSILLDDTLPAAQVRDTIRAAAPDSLVSITEFDRYQGKGIPEGKVSLSLRLIFRSPDRTLTDTEVQEGMDAIMAALRESHGALQR